MPLRRRALAALLVLSTASGCVPIEHATRTERGPLLRTFHRAEILEGELTASAHLEWPALSIEVLGHDTCRELEVEEYAEEKITERSSPAAGPALSMGIALTLASAILYGISPLLPSSPDRSTIDASGNYGPSTATVVRGWSIVALAVGLPALGVGIVSVLRTGVDTEHLKTEQVIGQHDQGCNERRLSGPVTFAGPGAPPLTRDAMDGGVSVNVSELGQGFETVTFAERPLRFDDDSRAVLEAFSACAELQAMPTAPLVEQSAKELGQRALALHGCRPARGESLTAPLREVEAELAQRSSATPHEGAAPGVAVNSFEEAVAKYAPALRLRAGSTDLDKLDDPSTVRGQNALVEGVITQGLAANIVLVQLGTRTLYLYVPPGRPFSAEVKQGTRVEAVVTLAGEQTLGQLTLPLARALWVRPAF